MGGGEVQDCPATETLKATCEPGEVASGGSSESSSSRTVSGSFSETITLNEDRPDPTSGTPTGWAADYEVDTQTINFSGPVTEQPSDPTVTVYVVCAS